MALNPAYWGPIFWEVMYLSSAGYSIKPTINEKIGFKMFYDSLRYVLPCVKCRVEYDNYLKNNPLNENDMSTRDNLFKWVYNVHKSVSTRLEKKTIPSLEASKRHFFITSSNAIVLPVRPRPTILAIKRQGITINGFATENFPRNVLQKQTEPKFAETKLNINNNYNNYNNYKNNNANIQPRFFSAVKSQPNNTEKHKLLNLLALPGLQPKNDSVVIGKNNEKNIVVFEKKTHSFKNFKIQNQGFIAPKPKFILGGCGCGGARNN
jgi:hypothetical protein